YKRQILKNLGSIRRGISYSALFLKNWRNLRFFYQSQKACQSGNTIIIGFIAKAGAFYLYSALYILKVATKFRSKSEII
uniref:hypothetical protein n=1 Tax=uncultured Campylobacter sp. TaxID=218934 RepID=UPI0025FEBAAB